MSTQRPRKTEDWRPPAPEMKADVFKSIVMKTESRAEPWAIADLTVSQGKEGH